MATILEFRPQTRSVAARALANAAEIVFFPGVRYERWDDEERRGDAPPRPRVRDVIETHDD